MYSIRSDVWDTFNRRYITGQMQIRNAALDGYTLFGEHNGGRCRGASVEGNGTMQKKTFITDVQNDTVKLKIARGRATGEFDLKISSQSDSNEARSRLLTAAVKDQASVRFCVSQLAQFPQTILPLIRDVRRAEGYMN